MRIKKNKTKQKKKTKKTKNEKELVFKKFFQQFPIFRSDKSER